MASSPKFDTLASLPPLQSLKIDALPSIKYPSDKSVKITKTDKHLILDLDETCIKTIGRCRLLDQLNLLGDPALFELRSRLYLLELEDPTSLRGEGDYLREWGIKRPHLEEFLEFAIQYFATVNVWTAGVYEYGHRIVEEIFKDLNYRPLIIFTREECITERKIVVKALARAFAHPDAKRHNMRAENTIILDDRPSAYLRDPYNGIQIPPYDPECQLDSLQKDDQCLPQFKQWLLNSEFSTSSDVRSYLRNLYQKNPSSIFSSDVQLSPESRGQLLPLQTNSTNHHVPSLISKVPSIKTEPKKIVVSV